MTPPWAADNIYTYRMYGDSSYHIILDQNKDKRSQSLSPLQRLGNDHFIVYLRIFLRHTYVLSSHFYTSHLPSVKFTDKCVTALQAS